MAPGNIIDDRIRIELVAGIDVPDATRAAWDELAAAAGTANIFYEHWAAAAAAGLPEGRGTTLLMAWQDVADAPPRLIGLLPLQRRKARIGAALQNWEQRARALGEPLIRGGHERAFWDGALAFLDQRRGLGAYLRLSALIADSPATRALHDVLAARGRRAEVTRSFERAVLRSGRSAADYVAANIRKKVLKEQRRLRSRLEEQGGLTVEALAADDDVDGWIDDLFRLEMTGWKGRDGVAAAADVATEHCFRAMLREAHARARLDFRRMTVGGKVIAMLANIEAGDAAFQLKIAYDEDHAAFSPGVLIEMDYLGHALDVRRLTQVDSCARAGHPMIERIWIDRLPIVSLAVAFDRWESRLACRVMTLARRWRGARGDGFLRSKD